jgi:glycosyltransferase involved in cell wall biosynthesis
VVQDNYNGFLCRMKDAEDLAAKMQRMATLDDNSLRQLGENGRKKMELEFDETLVIDKYMRALAELRVAS